MIFERKQGRSHAFYLVRGEKQNDHVISVERETELDKLNDILICD